MRKGWHYTFNSVLLLYADRVVLFSITAAEYEKAFEARDEAEAKEQIAALNDSARSVDEGFA